MPALSQLNSLWQDHGEAARIVIGCGFVAIGAGVLLPVPAVRDACGRVLERADVRKLLDEAAAWVCDRVSESLRRGGTPAGLIH